MPDYVKKCPECGGINLFWNRDKGEIICKDCGLVIEDKMVDFTHEWREFESDDAEKRRRTGAPMTYTQFDQGLGTEVGQKADLFQLRGKDRDKFFRLRKWQYRISTAIERNLKFALSVLKRDFVVAGVLYAACSRNEVPRKLDEFSGASGIFKFLSIAVDILYCHFLNL